MKMQKVLGTMKDIVTSGITRGAVQGALEAYAKRPAKRGSRVTWGDLQPLRNGALRAGKLPDLNR